MAAAAETIGYVSVDDLPEVALARQEIRDEGWSILETRRELLTRGEPEYVPLPIDVLTTAQKALEAVEKYGESSTQYKELLMGLQLDCLRLLAEWVRKNKPEYFPLVYQAYDPKTEGFYSHGLLINQMTENALVPINGDPEEESRRVNEHVENATPQIIRKIGGFALEGARVRTVSQCTDKAIADYVRDRKIGAPHRGYNGYVPEIEKVMVRDIRFDEVTGGRLEEQVGLPGIYITHAIFQEALRRRGIEAMAKNKTELHGTQLLAEDDLVESFVPHLDAVASEQWCTNIFMGEEVPLDHPKDYSSIRAEAQARQEKLKAHANMVADFVVGLAESKTDPRKAPAKVEEFVKKLLMNMARHDTSLAPQIFNDKTAEGLQKVAYLESIGRTQEAFELYQEVEKAAPGGGYCGAGSCGLEAVTPGSSDADNLKKLGFNTKDSIRDTKRKCVCGAETVYYDLKQAKKGCTSCGKTAKY